MIDLTKVYYFIFGLLTIGGGIMGYVTAHSQASLVAGGLSGILLLVAGYLIPAKLNVAFTLGLLVSVALAGRFVPAFLNKKAFMPAGMMAILSLIGLVLTLLAWTRK